MFAPWFRALGFPGTPVDLIVIGALVLARTLPLLFLSPFLGGRLVPGPVKVATALALTFFLVPLVDGELPASLPFFALLVKELAVGVTLGFVTSLVFLAFGAAGRLVDVQRGTHLAEALFPHLAERSSPFGRLFTQSAVIVFLIAGGHLVWLHAFATSFALLPVLAFPAFPEGTGPLLADLARISADFLLIALQLAAPPLLALFLTDVAFGIVGRAAPPFQAFLVAQPAKVAVGVFVVLLVIRGLVAQYDVQSREMLVTFYRFVGYLGG